MQQNANVSQHCKTTYLDKSYKFSVEVVYLQNIKRKFLLSSVKNDARNGFAKSGIFISEVRAMTDTVNNFSTLKFR